MDKHAATFCEAETHIQAISKHSLAFTLAVQAFTAPCWRTPGNRPSGNRLPWDPKSAAFISPDATPAALAPLDTPLPF